MQRQICYHTCKVCWLVRFQGYVVVLLANISSKSLSLSPVLLAYLLCFDHSSSIRIQTFGMCVLCRVCLAGLQKTQLRMSVGDNEGGGGCDKSHMSCRVSGSYACIDTLSPIGQLGKKFFFLRQEQDTLQLQTTQQSSR